MIDTNQFRWGLTPLPEGELLAAWGARAIFQHRELDFLHDRQQALGPEKLRAILGKWIDRTGLPELKKHIKRNGWSSSTQDVFELNVGPFMLKASPRGSYGYMYLTAVMKGSESMPDGQWSNTFIPKVGGFVMARINNLGKCRVLGFIERDGRVCVIAKPVKPPKWFVWQNGAHALCCLFGAEIEKIEKKQHHQEQEKQQNG